MLDHAIPDPPTSALRGDAVHATHADYAPPADDAAPAGNPPAQRRLIDVALPVPLYRNFSYAVDRTQPIALGSRVVVPFRSRREIGVVVGLDVAEQPGVGYKTVVAIPDPEPVLTPALIATCTWMAEHYVAPLGMVLRSALPARLTGAAAPAPSARNRRIASIARPLDSLLERERVFRRAPRQRELYELLESVGGRALVPHLVNRLKTSSAVVRALAQRGLVRLEDEADARDPFAARAPATTAGLIPTPAQREAVERIAERRAGDVVLLHGVTGSGKTLVYLEVLRRVVDQERATAIVLVPEIALTPQTVDRFRGVFGDRVAVLHSALSAGERLDAWRALERGDKRIAVGARSAIFAPLRRVGAIIVDEEHEASYKQNETPRYHARDVAIVRARHEGAVVVLGSATPSLESWTRVTTGKYTLVILPERVGGGTLPSIEIVELRQGQNTAREAPSPEPPARAERVPAPPQTSSGSRDPFRRVISERLEHALLARFDRGEQSILLLNRRGYAAFVQCTSCGDVAVCPDCSISLTYHRTPPPGRLVCHYCMHTQPVRERCLRCGAATVRERGLGTQQVERLLAERFPTVRLARMDVDTTSGKWAHAEILDRVAAGDVDVLLGTQMIAKGLDFPNVTLVGVVDADVGMNLPDFRAAERTYQLLAQVAGRAGRGEKHGEVIVQTRLRAHHAIRCAVMHDYHGFVGAELPHRVSPPYPPHVQLANVVFSGMAEAATEQLAQDATQWLRRLVTARDDVAVTLVGPAPCPVERIKQRWRWHTLLKSPRGADLTRVARYFAERYEVPDRLKLRAIVDRDPASLL